MREFEVKQKIEEAIKALNEYQQNLDEKRGVWYDDIQKSLPILIERSHVLNASGQVCPRCNGSGRL